MDNSLPFVIVRSDLAGVHVGFLKKREGREVTLVKSHRLWQWGGANTLSEVAVQGASISKDTCLSKAVEEISILDVFEIVTVVDPEVIKNLTSPRWLL